MMTSVEVALDGKAAPARAVPQERTAGVGDAARQVDIDDFVDPCVLLQAVRDADGEITDLVVVAANRMAADDLGYVAAGLIGRPLSALGTQPAGRQLVDLLRPVLADQRSVRLDDYGFMSRPDLRAIERWCDLRAVPAGADRVLWTWRDVTNRYQEQQGLRASRDRLRRSLTASPLGIAVTDLQGRFSEVNRSFSRFLGRDWEWLQNHSIDDVLAPGDDAAFRQIVRSLLVGDVAKVEQRQRFISTSGTTRDAVHTVALLWDQGSPAGYVSCIKPLDDDELGPPDDPPLTTSTVQVVCDDQSPLWGDALAALLERQPTMRVPRPVVLSALRPTLTDSPPDVVVALVGGAVRGQQQMSQLLQAMREYPDIGLVVLSAGNGRQAEELLRERSSAVAFLPAQSTSDVGVIVRAVDAVARGMAAIDREAIAELVGPRRPGVRLNRLSDREIQVLDLMAEGYDNHAIAERIFVSVKAVENYVGTIFRKLRLNDESGTNRRVRAALLYLGEF